MLPAHSYSFRIDFHAQLTNTDQPYGRAKREFADGKNRVAVQAARLYFSIVGDLRRYQRLWDYGPLGAELKRNVKELWWHTMTRQREDVAGLEATIIMSPEIWKASGHVATFSDPMCDCLLTKKRFRADQVEPQSGVVYSYGGAQNETVQKTNSEKYAVLLAAGKPPESARKTAQAFYAQRGLGSAENIVLLEEKTEKVENSTRFNPENGSLLTEPRPFNLMFKTFVGPVESEDNVAYLRPETAQAIFAQFKNVLETSRQKVPFGIAQVGKAFRNEVTPRNFTFRSREFEQMELEFFIKPDEVIEAIHGSVATVPETGHPGEPQPNWGWQAWHQYWVEERVRFYEGIGLDRSTLGFMANSAANSRTKPARAWISYSSSRLAKRMNKAGWRATNWKASRRAAT